MRSVSVPHGTSTPLSRSVADQAPALALNPDQYARETAELVAWAKLMRSQCPPLFAGAQLSRLRPELDPFSTPKPERLCEPFVRPA